jgi:hypothetical protein
MLCYFAHQFPNFVSDFIERGRTLRRRFREESVTDLLMGSLLIVGGSRVIVEFPDELRTGADMEWNFVNQDDSTFLRLLIQAKQLYGKGYKWKRLHYKEILRKAGKGPTLQARVLCDTARAEPATIPIYMFYNFASACSAAHGSGALNVAGVNWTDGYLVERLVAAATSRALRTRNKSLGLLQPDLFTLPDLLCPDLLLPPPIFARGSRQPPGAAAGPPSILLFVTGPSGTGVPLPPRPEDIHRRLTEARSSLLGTLNPITRKEVAATERIQLPDLPSPSRRIPDDVQATIARRETHARRTAGGAPRWRVTFLSRNPPSTPDKPREFPQE